MPTSLIISATHFYKASAKAPTPPKPPAPPSPTDAAENVAKQRLLERQKAARGFASTYLTAQQGPPDRPTSLLSTLLNPKA